MSKQLRTWIAIVAGLTTIIAFAYNVYNSVNRIQDVKPKIYKVNRLSTTLFAEPNIESQRLINRTFGQVENVVGISKDKEWARVQGFGLPASYILFGHLDELSSLEKERIKLIDSSFYAWRLVIDKYFGETKNGKEHGFGIAMSSDEFMAKIGIEEYYKGFYQEGAYHNFGMHFKNGNFYIGDFQKGKKHGYGFSINMGIIKGLATIIYSGEFGDGLFEGEGIMSEQMLGTVTIYKGHFENGEKFGKGVEAEFFGGVSGCFYQGEFKNGNYHGVGNFLCNDCSGFNGTFQNGERIGISKNDKAGKFCDSKFREMYSSLRNEMEKVKSDNSLAIQYYR